MTVKQYNFWYSPHLHPRKLISAEWQNRPTAKITCPRKFCSTVHVTFLTGEKIVSKLSPSISKQVISWRKDLYFVCFYLLLTIEEVIIQWEFILNTNSDTKFIMFLIFRIKGYGQQRTLLRMCRIYLEESLPWTGTTPTSCWWMMVLTASTGQRSSFEQHWRAISQKLELLEYLKPRVSHFMWIDF